MRTAQMEKALLYAGTHPQTVRLSWLDHRLTTSTAESAVELCADPAMAGNIVGAVADDKRLEELLNQIIDGE